MKKTLIVLIAFIIIFATAACDLGLSPVVSGNESSPEKQSSEPPEGASSSESSDIHGSSSETQSSEHSSIDKSEPSSSLPGADSSEESYASSDVFESSDIKEESSEDSSSEEPQESLVGDKLRPYYAILTSRKYCVKTVESKGVGGEAMPYTTYVYRHGDRCFVIIEESYGASSEFVIEGDYIYWIDSVNKTAVKDAFDSSFFSERKFFEGVLTLTDSGKETIRDTSYFYEAYRDSSGAEMTFFFETYSSMLMKYRYYDPKRKDTITITLNISDDLSKAIFEIPEDYTLQ